MQFNLGLFCLTFSQLLKYRCNMMFSVLNFLEEWYLNTIFDLITKLSTWPFFSYYSYFSSSLLLKYYPYLALPFLKRALLSLLFCKKMSKVIKVAIFFFTHFAYLVSYFGIFHFSRMQIILLFSICILYPSF